MRSHFIDGKTWSELLELLNSGRYDQLISATKPLLKKNARMPELWELVGTALLGKGDLKNAEKHLRKSLKINPSKASAQVNLANVYFAGSHYEAAANAFARYLKQNSADRTALMRFGQALLNSNQADRSKTYFESLTKSDAQNALAWFVLAQTYRHTGQISDALVSYRTAVEVDPEFKEAWFNLGNLYRDIDSNLEALACFETSLSKRPDHVPTILNVAHCYLQQGDLKTALTWIDKAVELDPENPEPQFLKSTPLFLAGNLKAGFAAAEWRHQLPDEYKKLYSGSEPLWDGAASLTGKSLIIHAEQGIGDTLMMLRFLQFLPVDECQVTVIVQQGLKDLVSRNFPAVTVLEFSGSRAGALPSDIKADLQCSLMSLAHLTRSQWDQPPASRSYIQAEAAEIRSWRHRITGSASRVVGIVWRGNPGHRNDQNRSIDLAHFLASLSSDHHYVVLQKDPSPAEVALISDADRLSIQLAGIDTFDDTASLCMALDCLVTVDTSVAHLGGALGLPTFILIPKHPDWRWGLEGAHSIWYPSVSLIRQGEFGQWQAPVEEAMKLIGAAGEGSLPGRKTS